jgi:phosphoglycolate phosphatase
MRKFSSPERTLSEIRRFVGYGAADLIAKSLQGGKDNPNYSEALEFFKGYYATHADIKTRPYDGVLAVLARLGEQGYPCAVVTNKPDEASRILCEKHFGSLLIDSVGDREGLLRKPAPDKVYDMMKRLCCDKAVFVGDAETDVLTAKNANIPCVCVTWGFRDREDMEAVGGKVFCDNAADMEKEILRIIKEICEE